MAWTALETKMMYIKTYCNKKKQLYKSVTAMHKLLSMWRSTHNTLRFKYEDLNSQTVMYIDMGKISKVDWFSAFTFIPPTVYRDKWDLKEYKKLHEMYFYSFKTNHATNSLWYNHFNICFQTVYWKIDSSRQLLVEKFLKLPLKYLLVKHRWNFFNVL